MKDFKVLLIYANTPMEPLVPLGTACIYTTLVEAGFPTKIFDNTLYLPNDESNSQAARANSMQVKPVDYTAVGLVGIERDPRDDFKKLVHEFKPDLIGLSCVELTYLKGLQLLETVKDLNIPTVIGGCFATFAAEYCINSDLIDMVCTGEGELIIAQLAEKLANKEPINKIEGLWVKEGDTIHRSKQNQLVDVNNMCIPKFDGFVPERIYRAMAGKIYRMVPIEISRGCPYQCTYCSAPMFQKTFKTLGRWLRYKTIDTIMKEVEYYVQHYDVGYFYMISETFLAMSPDMRQEFYTKYSKYKIPFWFNTRPETITEYDIKCLEAIGCHRISIGIESGNYEFRRTLLKRDYTNEQVIKAIEIVRKTKIQVSVNNMLGFPDETREMVFDTIELNRQFTADSHTISVFQPFRGTDLFDYSVEKGYWDPDRLCTDSFATPVLNMPSMSKEEIKGLYRTFNLYLNMDKSQWDKVREAERLDKEGDRVFAEIKEALFA